MQAEIRWALTARPKSVSLWLPLAPSSGYSLPSGSIHRSGNNRDAADTSGPDLLSQPLSVPKDMFSSVATAARVRVPRILALLRACSMNSIEC